MSTQTAKNNVRWNAKPANNVTLVVGNQAATTLFGGLTLHQLGAKHGLMDEDIRIVTSTNPNNQEKIKQLAITIEGTTYVIPFSRSFPMDKLNDANFLLNCKFRGGFMSVKESDGTPKTDENGKVVLADGANGHELKPYLSFGKPEGIVIEEEESLFAPLTAEELAKITAGS